MKCKITLDNGKPEGLFRSKGELNMGEKGFALFYDLDGDKCLLSYSDGKLVQERRGGVPMTMVFKEGEETLCTLGYGKNKGTFPLFTNKIEINYDETSVCAKLNYTCGGENVTLNITAKV